MFKYLFHRIGFWIPTVLCLIVMFNHGNGDYHIHILPNLILALCIIIGANFFEKWRIDVPIELLGMTVLNFQFFVNIVHLYLYDNFFSKDTAFILFETNASESGEFMATYLDGNLLGVGGMILIFMILSFVLIIKNRHSDRITLKQTLTELFDEKIEIRNSLIIPLLLVGVILLHNPIKNRQFFMAYALIKGYIEYKQEQSIYSKLGSNKKGGKFSNVLHGGETDESETYILILGESTTKHHMGIYGYYRDTNPLLGKYKDELLIYSDVISPHTNTIPSLTKVLTLGNYEHLEGKYEGSIIQLFNKAGFETYWLSTQDPVGLHETFVTRISNACSYQNFVSSYGNRVDDDSLLEPLQEILSQKNQKKLIIIHLMGTHAFYENRYPESYNIFHDKPITKFEHEEAYNAINKYDNAVLFNDFVISEIIRNVRSLDDKSWVLYLSDHGEDAFQTINANGHLEKDGTQPMYDIPFIIWLSEKYKVEHTNMVFETDRKYMTDDLIYTLSDLGNIKFEEFDSTRSIINTHFQYKRRMISNGKENYDDIFDELSSIE